MKHQDPRNAHDGLDRSSITAFAIASQVAVGISASLVGGALLGWYLDQHVFHDAVPLATLLGLLLGLAADVYGLIRLLSLLNESRVDSSGAEVTRWMGSPDLPPSTIPVTSVNADGKTPETERRLGELPVRYQPWTGLGW